jgi:hypothetical protein
LLKIKPVKEWRSIYFIIFMFVWVWHVIVIIIGWAGLVIGWIPAVPIAFLLATENGSVVTIRSLLDPVVWLVIIGSPFILKYWLVEKYL